MAQPTDLEHRTRDHLNALENSGLRRRLQRPDGVDLCSNDYLGLASHPFITQRMAEAVTREGSGATASRLLRGERDCFSELERRFAAFKGTERALYFNSGYLANIGVLSAFPEKGDVVFSDELNHASLIDGMRLSKARRVIFPHRDVEALRPLLLSEQHSAGQRFLVTESLFSMDGDLAPLQEYADLCRSTHTALIVDEAHAVGIYGECGSGWIEATSTDDDVFLSINTCGKALGVCGAAVCGPEWAIEYLLQRARTFVFSTAPTPAVAAALEAALTIVQAEPERRDLLFKRAVLLREALAQLGVPVAPGSSPIIPIRIGDNTRALYVAARLQAEGFDIRAIRPPTVPPGTARLRVAVNIKVDDETLRRFAASVAAALDSPGSARILRASSDGSDTFEKASTLATPGSARILRASTDKSDSLEKKSTIEACAPRR